MATTTIILTAELLQYVREQNINLSQFVRDALYEHSGNKETAEKHKLEEEIKKMKLKIAIKETIIKEIEAKNKEKKQKIKDFKAKKEKEADFFRTHCKGCNQEVKNLKVLKFWGGYCPICGEEKAREDLNDERKDSTGRARE
jgi:tRNA G10  N-methylase Trm11